MYQPTLMDIDAKPDIITVGHSKPTIRHPDHRLKVMRRPFISWDGEGYTDEWGQHHYWLLANSLGDRIESSPGKSIDRWTLGRVFNSVQSRVPDGIHVGFALGYDFTMALRSNGLSELQRESLKNKQYMADSGYMWRVMMGKQLTVWSEAGGSQADRFNLQDTWGFFQRSFINALDEYFGKDWPHRDTIVEMKAKRAQFTRDDDVQVKTYNDMELELLVTLMDELRDRLYQSGMPVSRWYGPGAIANSLLQQWKIKSTIIDLYTEAPNLAAVSQHAYAGGRFELVKPGHVNGNAYQYDVNSAYPHALRNVPNLADGHWQHYNQPNLADLPPFSVVRLRWNTNIDNSHADYTDMQQVYPESIPFPFWKRIPNGTISFPSTGIHGWFWYPEVVSGINYSNLLPDYYHASYTIEEAYGYHPNNPADRPFDRIELLYHTRQKLKASGSGSHIGIKLGLNSLYGKFAQQIGYSDDNQRIPQYHNLAIAGYITATCRAMMIDAMATSPNSIIAFETDGIFSTEKLPLRVSSRLGEWEATEWDDMWYYQSGFRFGLLDGAVKKPATRGVPSKDISLPQLQDKVRTSIDTLSIDHTQFITLAQAYAWRKPHLAGQWQTKPRELAMMLENPGGKRIHDSDCPQCAPTDDGIRQYGWDSPHLTLPRTGFEGQLNSPHRVLWNPKVGGTVDPEDFSEVLIEP